VLVVALIPLSWSVGHALTMPGGGTMSERLAEWARDHYLGPLVTLGEKLTYQAPKVGGAPSFALTAPPAASQPAPGVTATPPARLKSLAGHPLPGEGVWRVVGTVGGQPAMYATYLRASKVYSSYVSGIVSINQSLVKFSLRPGTEDPGPGNWHAQPDIPPGTRRGLLATFNGGFKISSSDGGFYLNGKTYGRLTKGVASIVYYRDGQIAIGNWGHGGLHLAHDVAGVRQNLHLIVAHGKVPASVDYDVEGSWGATLGGGYYVWRSGIGITSTGRVIFAYGPALDVRELAQLLQRAGAVTAMQLDINPDWMSFMYYKHDQRANPVAVNLLPDQIQPPDRYYYPANRDFTAVYAR
jgi:Phosphodiester glycosidase